MSWRDLPEYYRPWQTVYKRFAQWLENGKLESLFDQLREGADMQDLSIVGIANLADLKEGRYKL